MSYQTREHAFKLYQAALNKYIDCFNVASNFEFGHAENDKEIFVLLKLL